eukprot:847660-Prymnesium_polylepis.3
MTELGAPGVCDVYVCHAGCSLGVAVSCCVWPLSGDFAAFHARVGLLSVVWTQSTRSTRSTRSRTRVAA